MNCVIWPGIILHGLFTWIYMSFPLLIYFYVHFTSSVLDFNYCMKVFTIPLDVFFSHGHDCILLWEWWAFFMWSCIIYIIINKMYEISFCTGNFKTRSHQVIPANEQPWQWINKELLQRTVQWVFIIYSLSSQKWTSE